MTEATAVETSGVLVDEWKKDTKNSSSHLASSQAVVVV